MTSYWDWVDIEVCCSHEGSDGWESMWTDGEKNVKCPKCGQEYHVVVSILPIEEIPAERLKVLE